MFEKKQSSKSIMIVIWFIALGIVLSCMQQKHGNGWGFVPNDNHGSMVSFIRAGKSKKTNITFLSSSKGTFSWIETVKEEHCACIGNKATNDTSECPHAEITYLLQAFCWVLEINVLAIGDTRINNYFHHNLQGPGHDGLFHWIPIQIKDCILLFSFNVASEIKKMESIVYATQIEAKK